MKREILFRGKRIDNSEWIEGYFYEECGATYIIEDRQKETMLNRNTPYKVLPETVGQFTGFYAQNKKSNLNSRIFEDDIFRGFNANDEEVYYVVMWIVQRGAFYMVPIEHYEIIKNHNVSEETEFSWLFDDALLYDFSLSVVLTKVGNIHDNPESINT